MKTTSRFRTTLSLITIGLLACTGLAVAATSDNYAESFETYEVGDTASNLTAVAGSVWTATETNSMVVATNYTASYQGGTYPIAYDHTVNTKVLKVQNGVTNTIASGTASQTNWVDTVIKPVFADAAPELPTVGSMAGLYFNTNGNPVIMHTPSNLTTYAEWVEIPDVTVSEGSWIRVTIVADMASSLSPVQGTRFYQVMINGTVITNAAAFPAASRSGGGGSWFGNRISFFATDSVTNVIVKGTGYLDDLVVTNALTVTAPTKWMIDASAGTNGTINPSGSVSVVEGNPQSFTITPDTNYMVDEVTVVENGVTTNLGAVTSYTFSNVMTNGSITASFAPEQTWTITVNAVTNGSITPTGSVTVVQGGSQEFTIAPDSGYLTESVTVVENGVTTNLGVVTSYTFSNVMTNGSIGATFVLNENGPPASWLSDTGVDAGDLDTDLRGDGMTPSQAWLASTHPTDTNFSFEVIAVDQVGGTNYIEWVSVYADTNLPPFAIWARTNLMDTTYDQVGSYPRTVGATSSTPVTNIWSEIAPAYPIYYRVAATNAPSAP